MMKQALNHITILGSGTSTGIPMLNCRCTVCLSSDPLNKRLRTGLHIHLHNGRGLLIDTTPDLRQQLLRENIHAVDGALLTHDHADHLHGIDDMRPFTFGPPARELPVFVPSPFLQSVANRFPYIFKRHEVFHAGHPYKGGGLPLLNMHPFNQGDQDILGEPFHFFQLPHGHSSSFGFAHGRFGYIIDCHRVEDSVVSFLRQRKLELLIIDCLQEEPHNSHLTRTLSFAAIEAIAPKKAVLIHMNHHFDHHQLQQLADKELRTPTTVAHDGMKLVYSC